MKKGLPLFLSLAIGKDYSIFKIKKGARRHPSIGQKDENGTTDIPNHQFVKLLVYSTI
jgi:hypothetical protein